MNTEFETHLKEMELWLKNKSEEIGVIVSKYGVEDSLSTLIHLGAFEHRFSFWDALMRKEISLRPSFKNKDDSITKNVTGPIFEMKRAGLKDLAYFLNRGADKLEMTSWNATVEFDIYADFSWTRSKSLRVHQSNLLEVLDPELDTGNFVKKLFGFYPFHRPLYVTQELKIELDELHKNSLEEFDVLVSQAVGLYQGPDPLPITLILKTIDLCDSVVDCYMRNSVFRETNNLFLYHYLRWDFHNFSGLVWSYDKPLFPENYAWVWSQLEDIKSFFLSGYNNEEDEQLQDYYLSFIEFIETRGAKAFLD